MMTKNEYEKILVKIFGKCKSDIIENNKLLKEQQKEKAKVLCIPSQEEKKIINSVFQNTLYQNLANLMK